MIDWLLLFRTLPPIVAEVGLWTAQQDSVTVSPATSRYASALLLMIDHLQGVPGKIREQVDTKSIVSQDLPYTALE